VDVYAVFAPDRIWTQGLEAIQSLGLAELRGARQALTALVLGHPHEARYRMGLASVCALLYDSTRADPWPDIVTLQRAVVEAHEAVRLSPELPEAFAALAFVLERNGDHEHAVIAARRAVRLEPDNWLHHVRLASLCWGPERQNAVRAALRLNAGLAIAWFMGAAVPVATGVFDEAVKMVDAGIRALDAETRTSARFKGLALHYLRGLLLVEQGHLVEALEVFADEIARETQGHVYARECCANAFYASGACHLLLGDLPAAQLAFLGAVRRIPHHPLAWIGLRIVGARRHEGDVCVLAWTPGVDGPRSASLVFEHEMARAAWLVDCGDVTGAVQLLRTALQSAAPGNTGWLIPVDPLLRVRECRDVWEPVLELLRTRAR
jgi:tetratricopeptide (TPR) repeat protein